MPCSAAWCEPGAAVQALSTHLHYCTCLQAKASVSQHGSGSRTGALVSADEQP